MPNKDPAKAKEWAQKYYAQNKERWKEYRRKYKAAHRKEINKRQKQYRAENPEKLKRYQQKYHENHAKKRKEYSKIYRERYRNMVLEHYGSKCACCGETHNEFLTIDHVYNNGAEHRKKINNIYVWIVKNDFPDGFQILCWNCNCAKGFYGECPHKREQNNDFTTRSAS